MNKKGIILVISGFSGVGKGTIVKRLLEEYGNYELSVSVTTRGPRDGESHGKDYFFITEEEFASLEKEGGLLESAGFVNHHYGTPSAYVMDHLDSGKDMILEIESKGAFQVKEKYPDAVLVFILPPDAGTLKNRLLGRGTESLSVIEERLSKAVEESERVSRYDYVLVNDDLENCVEDVHRIVLAEHKRACRNEALINSVRTDLIKVVEGE